MKYVTCDSAKCLINLQLMLHFQLNRNKRYINSTTMYVKNYKKC